MTVIQHIPIQTKLWLAGLVACLGATCLGALLLVPAPMLAGALMGLLLFGLVSVCLTGCAITGGAVAAGLSFSVVYLVVAPIFALVKWLGAKPQGKAIPASEYLPPEGQVFGMIQSTSS